MVHGGASGLARDPLVGQVLSQRYRILARLGEGAMATVYLAEHTGVGATIVLKVLLPELANEPQVVESFLREARIASEIHHDNVIDIFYSGRSPEGHVFLAMEYVNGATLFDLLDKEGPLPWARAKPILVGIAAALAAAHQHGVVHRDVKPENVLVGTKETPAGTVEYIKVVDFGIANARGEGDASVCGTPAFMPPEQAQGLAPDLRDDVYAFGCLMYQVLTGDVPFRDNDMAKVLLMHLRDPVVPPRQRRPDLEIPAAAQAIVMCALEKKRADRWQDMGEVQRMLEQVVVEEPAPKVEEPPPPGRLAIAAAAAPAAAAEPPARIVMPKQHGPVRSRLPAILGAVLILGAFAYVFIRQAMHNAPGRLELVTDPADAEIYVDGQKMADRSPMFLDATPGSYSIIVRSPGYETLTRVLVMKAGLTERVPLTLTALEVPKPTHPAPRPRAAPPPGEASRRRGAPPVNGVTFIDFKKAASEQRGR